MTVSRSQPINEHTPTPWVYRPNKHDDWGWIRDADGNLAATARDGRVWSDQFDEYRSKKADPYEANAAFIVEAVNNYAALKARVAELEGALSECLGQMGWSNYTDDETRHEEALGSGIATIILRGRAALAGPVARGGER